MPIRIALSNNSGGDWITSDEIIARAINFAWKNGAHILSNSWGGGLISDVEEVAWRNALQQGRGGKGCIVLAAAGNESGPVNAPANYPPILCISASNDLDTFKRKNDGSSEYWWGSCFGPEVLIAAPGVQNMTTDITGRKGYDPSHYTASFNGTSSSTPIAAGAVGLLLSMNPSASTEMIKKILMDSADKVGTDVYVNGRNNFMGYGRLNVLKAVNIMKERMNQPVVNEVVGVVESYPGKIFFTEYRR
jgi:subtilisin family serine protease